MDAINNINRIMQVLRRRLAEKESTQKISASSSSATSKQHKAQAKASTQQLQVLITNKLKNIKGEGPQWHQRAAQVFFESVLAWEFGDDFVQDPHCPELVREMHDMMQLDPQTWKRFNRFLSRLAH